MGGEGKAQDEGGDGLGDRLGPSEDLRALGGPHGHVGSEARPRVKLMMDLGIDLDLVKISELQGDPMGMWVVRARPWAKVMMGLGIDLDLVKI